MDSGSPFAALLIGQPTLRHRLRLGVLAALDQRISVRYAIAGMTADDTAGYLNHHRKIAGRADTLFSTDAVTVFHDAARGYPRAVNNLAINPLTAAFAWNQAIVDESRPNRSHRKRRRLNPGTITETDHDITAPTNAPPGPWTRHSHTQH